MHKRLLVFVLLLILVLAIWLFYNKSAFFNNNTPLELSGNVDIREVNLAFRVSGRVQQVLVDEGDVISQAGQTLAILDKQPLILELQEAEANLAAAKASLDLMLTGYKPQDIAQAYAQLQAKQAVLINAQKTYNRQKQLLATGAISLSDLDDAKSSLDLAIAEVDAANLNYQSLKSGYRKQEIEQARATADQAKANVNKAKLALDDAQLIAYGTGVIITRSIEPGSMVTAGTSAFTLSLNEPVWIRAYVEAPYLGQVAPGTAVHIYTDAPQGKVYNGTVGFVSPTAEFTPKQVQTSDLRTGLVYRLRIIVNDPDKELRQGMPVVVRLTAQ